MKLHVGFCETDSNIQAEFAQTGYSFKSNFGEIFLVQNGGGSAPPGGLTGQVLLKHSDSDYDTYWGTTAHFDTTENWNAQINLIGLAGHIYVYTDYSLVDGQYIPAIKIGDGISYLIDNPIIIGNAAVIDEHIHNSIVHITDEERTFWNNKMRAYTIDNEEKIVFTTD